MSQNSHLYIIDTDHSRRAALTSGLLAADTYAEPFETVEELAQFWPDRGVVLFFDRPGVHPALHRTMEAKGLWLPALAYGPQVKAERIVQLMVEGALGYLEWPLAIDEIPARIADLLARNAPMVQSASRAMMARIRLTRLTAREREVLELVAEGASTKMVARQLDISPRTVEIHRAHALAKMQATSTADAIRIALEARQAAFLRAA